MLHSSICFVNASEGWIAGGILLHTTDGGNSWTIPIQEPLLFQTGHRQQKFWPDKVHFLDAQRGWIAGRGIFSSTDGGVTWSPELQKPFGFRDMHEIIFLTSDIGWAVGEGGAIFRTGDGGLTWEIQNSNTSVDLFGAHFITSQEGWVVGVEGTILHTTNGGHIWMEQQSGTRLSLNSVQFLNAREGWAVGGAFGEDAGIVLHTLDGGRNWKVVENAPVRLRWLKDVHFADPQTGWIVGLGTILHTEDGGQTWTEQHCEGVSRPRAVHFVDGMTGWMVSMDSIIAHTENGGNDWEVQYMRPNTPLEAVYFANHQEGWAGGALGNVLLHTVDGGQTWYTQPAIGNGSRLESICYGGPRTLWAVGEGGTLLRYSDPERYITPPSYWAVDLSGKRVTLWGDVKRFALLRNYPNPFNPDTWMPFQLVQDADVTIRIRNIQGHLVRELALGRKPAGMYLDKGRAAHWDGRDNVGLRVSNGQYFYTIHAGDFTATRAMVILK